MTFAPTEAAPFQAICHCCGREATGIGLGQASRSNADPRWLCEACVAEGRTLFDAARGKRFSFYERRAIERAVDAVGPFVERHGTDLAEWEGDTAEEFVRAIWQACGDELRAVIREGDVF